MFLEYYHLREQPFGVTPDPRFLYFGPAHREALATLMYSIESRRGFSAMVAEPGMGKTTLLFRLLETLRSTSRTAFLFQTEGDSRDLLRGVLADLGIATQSSDLTTLHETLNGALLEEMRAGRQVVVVFDEAQNLDEKSLESVRLLSNFETATHKLMHIVLAGQPRLGERLAGPDLKQLLQRVSTIVRLDPFAPEETAAYIDWRLRTAGYEGGPLFSPEALDLIARVSKGVPRNINSLCFQALSIGFAMQSKTIGADILREVVADLDPSPRPSHRGKAPAAPPPIRAAAPAAAVAARGSEPAPVAAPSLAASSVAAPSVAARVARTPASSMAAAPIWNSWAIAPPHPQRSFPGKGLAILACVAVPVALVLVFSNPRLSLSGTPAGKLSGQVVNAVLSSGDPNSDFVPSLPNGLKPPSAPAIGPANDTSSSSPASGPPPTADDAVSTGDPTSGAAVPQPSAEPETPAAVNVATKSLDRSAAPVDPADREAKPVNRRESVIQVSRRENLFEFALENYGKSNFTIVDDIRRLNPQLKGPYDMLQPGEWIQLPSEPASTPPESRSH